MRKRTLILLSLITINSISAEFILKIDSKSAQVFVAYDLNGFNTSGLHKETGTLYNPLGFKQNGFDVNGEKPRECKKDGFMEYIGQSYAYNRDSEGGVIRLADNSLSKTLYNQYAPNVQTGFVSRKYWNNDQVKYNYNYGQVYWEGQRLIWVHNWDTRAVGSVLLRETLEDRRIDYTKVSEGALYPANVTNGNEASGYQWHFGYYGVASVCRQEFEL